ncbi:MAG: hypothetical protein SGI72_01215 [Planctomycetota bacterium]|nr:hypothetical protein [Planctomycetota bacterium]
MSLATPLILVAHFLQEPQHPPIQVDPRVGPDDAAVDECISRGVEFLLRSQNRDGSWTTESTATDRTMDLRNAQTAFSAYTLLKCRVNPKHPAIQRALAHLEGFVPLTTYACGVELLFYGALHDVAHQARMQRDVTQLLEMRSEKGWGYTEERSRSDPSNIQYALLGLRAAAQSGLKVPREIWSESIEAMQKFQETPITNGTVRTGIAARDVSSAGFHYADSETKATGAMTTTGISVLAMCDEMLQGKVPTTIAADFVRAKAEALAWLDDHFAVDVNPDGNEAWKYYYLYGLERMGSLLGLERIGNHLWYKAGATELVRAQASDGSWSMSGGKTEWPPRPMTNANTCFALLFLGQATKVTSGPVRARAFDGWVGEDVDADVWLRARASGGFAACISGFSPTFVSLHGEARSLRIVSVEWTVDGAASPKLEDRLGAKFDAGTFVLRHAFRSNGKHTLTARVGFLRASAPPDELVQYAVSKPLVVHVRDVLESWMMPYAQGTKSLITEANVESITATSQYDAYTAAWRALDGLQFHGWVCKAEDATPRIAIELDKPVRAKTLVLSQPNACERDADLYGRVTKVRVTWNDDPKFVDVDIDADPLKKTVFELPRPLMVRRIELAILTRTPGRNGDVAGFAEVELLGPESAR